MHIDSKEFIKQCAEMQKEEHIKQQKLKVAEYEKYQLLFDFIIEDVRKNDIFEEHQKNRFISFLLKSKGHCKGMANTIRNAVEDKKED